MQMILVVTVTDLTETAEIADRKGVGCDCARVCGCVRERGGGGEREGWRYKLILYYTRIKF